MTLIRGQIPGNAATSHGCPGPFRLEAHHYDGRASQAMLLGDPHVKAVGVQSDRSMSSGRIGMRE